MAHRYPYTCISNPVLPSVAKHRFEPLIRIGLQRGNNVLRIETYIDTGSQWCLFDNSFAKLLGIDNYKDTKDKVSLSGVGGKQPENIGYFHNIKLLVFKDNKNLKIQNAWPIDTKIGFLDRTIGFAGILGVYGFLDQFRFKTDIPAGYFELEPIYHIED